MTSPEIKKRMTMFEPTPIEEGQPDNIPKERSIWGNLGWALAAIPITTFVGLLIITFIGAIDDGITKLQLAGHWWIIPIGAYFLSLIYLLCQPTFRRNRKRKEAVNIMLLYWKEQITKQNKPKRLEMDIEQVREMLRGELGEWDELMQINLDSRDWYLSYLFGVVDNLMEKIENLSLKVTGTNSKDTTHN